MYFPSVAFNIDSDILCAEVAIQICTHARGRLRFEMACSFKSGCQADVLFVVARQLQS